MKKLIVLLLSLVFTFSAYAEDELTLGLKVGENIPADFLASNQDGELMELKELTGKKGLILLFTRSAYWCGYCKAQLKQWGELARLFEVRGYNVAGMTYDSVEQLKRFREKTGITYPLLSDTNSMIKAFGLRNTNFEEGSRFYGVAHPAIYVINPNGKITHRFSNKGYEKRPPVGAVYHAVFGELIPEH